MMKITVWNEFVNERRDERARRVYPDGIHLALQRKLSVHRDFEVRTATLEEPEHGLSTDVLATTDVLLWWGHRAHDQVSDEIVARVHERMLEGMGLIVLHSGHASKIFRRALGTSGSLRWREAGERERLWTIEPSHPIAAGVGDYVELPAHEMYGERFDIPTPESVVFLSWFQGGEVFRSGCTWQRGHGRIFYFSPGHETYPIYHNDTIIRIIANAVRWARPTVQLKLGCVNSQALEQLAQSRP